MTVIGDCIYNLDMSKDYYWVGLGFRFVGLDQNEHYQEKNEEEEKTIPNYTIEIKKEDFLLRNK